MNVIKTAIEGVVIIEPRIFEDSREKTQGQVPVLHKIKQ